ncbi:MAG: prolyl oligopeptidase family serine peptidase [Actinomycetota bacterium]
MEEHLWLEEVEGEQALAWVREQNDRTLEALEAHPAHAGFLAAATDALTAADRIPYGSIRNGWAYNFWQDDEHVKGIWRRVPAERYLADDLTGAGADGPDWELLLDIDALAETEGENWVFAGANACRVDGKPNGRYLVSLSIGGRDATTVREYDISTGEFIDDGFVSPEAKQAITWLDADTVLVATDWGDGTVTESGYPCSVRRWRRGEPLAAAAELFRGETTDVGVWPLVIRSFDGTELGGAVRRTTFFTGSYALFPDGGELLTVPLPEKADLVGTFEGRLFATLQEDWTTGDDDFISGDLIALDLRSIVRPAVDKDGGGDGDATIELVFRPTDRQAITGVAIAEGRVLLAYADTVVSQLAWLDRPTDVGSGWELHPVELPGRGDASIVFSDDEESTILITYQDFLNPDSLLWLDTGGDGDKRGAPRPVRSTPARFDAAGLTVDQRFATSSDGTEIPYFLVRRSDLTADGSTPTLLYGYGGFEIPLTPAYSPTVGRLWLEQGGAYVVANIRGGGEFGPSWHQAGLKQRRQTVYDDFIAVAEHLVADGTTSPRHLGIMGGSNGGLLMGVMLTQRPDLWRGIVIQVPLLDMLRFHLLLAGASWVDEYGSPDDPDERAFLETISPYHRFDPAADYPTPFFVTSTKDDRVHPAHARKLAKRFEEADKPFWYFENIDGGHGAATTQLERAKRIALEFTYLTERLTD